MTPICFLISLYSAFVYGKSQQAPSSHGRPKFSARLLTNAPGILYANLGGFAIVFQEIRGWGPVTGNLPFLAMLLGMCGAGLLNIYNNKQYFNIYRANGDRAVPEARLPPMMIGGVFFAVGLFLFGCESRLNPPTPPSHSHPASTNAPRVLKPQRKLLALHHRHLPHRRRLHGHLPIIAQLPR